MWVASKYTHKIQHFRGLSDQTTTGAHAPVAVAVHPPKSSTLASTSPTSILSYRLHYSMHVFINLSSKFCNYIVSAAKCLWRLAAETTFLPQVESPVAKHCRGHGLRAHLSLLSTYYVRVHSKIDKIYDVLDCAYHLARSAVKAAYTGQPLASPASGARLAN